LLNFNEHVKFFVIRFSVSKVELELGNTQNSKCVVGGGHV